MSNGVDAVRQEGRGRPVADVGIVSFTASRVLSADKAIKYDNPTHVLVAAPLGAGKSAALRYISNACRSSGGVVAFVNLEGPGLKPALEVSAEDCAFQIMGSIIQSVAPNVAKLKYDPDTQPDGFRTRTAKVQRDLEKAITGHTAPGLIARTGRVLHDRYQVPGGVVLLDELEALITHNRAPESHRTDLLEILKNWCENTSEYFSIVVAATEQVRTFIRRNAPKVTSGRLSPVSEFFLEEDDVALYLEEKLTYNDAHRSLAALVDDDAVDWLASSSRGLPRYLEQIASRAWDEARSEGEYIDVPILRQSILLLAGDQLYSLIRSLELPEAERTALRRLIRYGTTSDSCGDKLRPKDRRALYRLHRRSLRIAAVEKPARGKYQVSSELLREAMRAVD